jgi:hypothetical protein
MLSPGFTADASLPAETSPRAAYGGGIVHEPPSQDVEPAIPGSTERAYIDCVTDCRIAARFHQIADLGKCIRDCAGNSGTQSGADTSKGAGTSGSTAIPPPALCPTGNVAVTCPDGFIGCCPSIFPKCTIVPLLGRLCVPF